MWYKVAQRRTMLICSLGTAGFFTITIDRKLRLEGRTDTFFPRLYINYHVSKKNHLLITKQQKSCHSQKDEDRVSLLRDIFLLSSITQSPFFSSSGFEIEKSLEQRHRFVGRHAQWVEWL